MHRANPDDEQETPAKPQPLEYSSLPLSDAEAKLEADAETSRWFSYIAVGIVLVSMLIGLLAIVGGSIYFLSR